MFIVRTVHIYVVTMYPHARQMLPVDARMFMQFVEQQSLFVFFVTCIRRVRLIANDRAPMRCRFICRSRCCAWNTSAASSRSRRVPAVRDAGAGAAPADRCR
jgi:hypothetical protein